jgi:trimeric autotransporter adhesin
LNWGGVQDHARGGGQEVMSLGYDQFIAPLIKAVQELTARVAELEGRTKKK